MPSFLPWLVLVLSLVALAVSNVYHRRSRQHALDASAAAMAAFSYEKLAMGAAVAAEESVRFAGAQARNARQPAAPAADALLRKQGRAKAGATTGFIQHGPGEFCAVLAREGEALVVADGQGSVPASSSETSGRCANCGRAGTVYEVPPLGADAAASTEAFTRWLRAVLGHADEVGEPYAAAHQQLLDMHGRVEMVVMGEVLGSPPTRAQQCKECGGDGWPCPTLRVVAGAYRSAWPRWDERWAA
ncbi:hypothetical protein ETD86_46585 [Nonomuraea turkmeniaca]|uniref:Uncharacterized protein n=1 Tax=Nonomuraea turkmeniaca TaxID=103838 RepID=A0A5S4EYC8_9ACTN|nr:hypothetical protein [Nonomuraea turkmeniaca]TMR08720.1 hypothetical protein ETD86_46585 [Nonomuraea turkmeniaca]